MPINISKLVPADPAKAWVIREALSSFLRTGPRTKDQQAICLEFIGLIDATHAN